MEKKYDVFNMAGAKVVPTRIGANYGHASYITLLTKENKYALEPQTCKDYLNDLMYGCIHPTSIVSTYGIAKGNALMVDLENPRLLVGNNSMPAFMLYPKFMRAMDAANAFLSSIGVRERVVVDTIVGDKESKTEGIVLVFSLPKFLVKAPPLLSMVIVCLRSLFSFDKTKTTILKYLEEINLEASYNGVGVLITGNSDKTYVRGGISALNFFKRESNIYKVFAGSAKQNWAFSKSSVHAKFGIAHFGGMIDGKRITKKDCSYAKLMLKEL